MQTGKKLLATGKKNSREIRKQPGKLGNLAGFPQPGRVPSEWPNIPLNHVSRDQFGLMFIEIQIIVQGGATWEK